MRLSAFFIVHLFKQRHLWVKFYNSVITVTHVWFGPRAILPSTYRISWYAVTHVWLWLVLQLRKRRAKALENSAKSAQAKYIVSNVMYVSSIRGLSDANVGMGEV